MAYETGQDLKTTIFKRWKHPNALISNSQDSLSVRADDEINISPSGLFHKIRLHCVLVQEGQIYPLASPEQMGVIRDRLRLCHNEFTLCHEIT
jgi:hypothetical protein